MVIDKIENVDIYKNISPRIKKALEYLEKAGLANVEAGKYEIDGDLVFALVSEYKTKHATDAKLEAHKKYLDVQYVADGRELLGYAAYNNQEVSVPYKDENDIAFFNGDKVYMKFNKGMFAILYPQDLHMPGIMAENPEKVKKVVVKVKI